LIHSTIHPMSDTSHDNNDEIQLLRQQLAQLREEVASLHLNPNPTQIDAPRAKHLVIPEELIHAMPSIDGKHFFIKPSDPDEDHLFTETANFPKNPKQQYNAPTLELPFPSQATTYQAFDKTLAKLQERQAFSTWPVDEFATEIFACVEDPQIREAVADFLHVIRLQLAVTAQQIHDLCLDNYVRATGAKPAPEKENGVFISKDDITARIKAAAEYAKASNPAKNSTAQNTKNGRQRKFNRY
ncbi:hypothetical protein BGZ76_007351, partial [Entomortierella beljakovae]